MTYRRRRGEDESFVDVLFDFLMVCPWWVGLALAPVVYGLMGWLLPWLLLTLVGGTQHGTALLGAFANLLRMLAPWLGGAVLFVWVATELKKWVSRRRLDAQSVLDTIDQLSWQQFEELLGEAFRRQGFQVKLLGKAGPDGGIDLHLSKAGAVTLVQCKHWKLRRVGVAVVRELMGVVASERAHAGIVVTSGGFTDDAREFAHRNPIRLIGGEELTRMIREVQSSKVKATTAALEQASLAAAPPPPSCPRCGGAMVRRKATRGSNAGSFFLGCSHYPKCRGTLPV